MILFCVIILSVNNKHRKTLSKLLTKPTLRNIRFDEVDSLLFALGFERIEGSGSRVTFSVEGVFIVLHKPHPKPVLKPYVVKQLVEFLKNENILE